MKVTNAWRKCHAMILMHWDGPETGLGLGRQCHHVYIGQHSVGGMLGFSGSLFHNICTPEVIWGNTMQHTKASVACFCVAPGFLIVDGHDLKSISKLSLSKAANKAFVRDHKWRLPSFFVLSCWIDHVYLSRIRRKPSPNPPLLLSKLPRPSANSLASSFSHLHALSAAACSLRMYSMTPSQIDFPTIYSASSLQSRCSLPQMSWREIQEYKRESWWIPVLMTFWRRQPMSAPDWKVHDAGLYASMPEYLYDEFRHWGRM